MPRAQKRQVPQFRPGFTATRWPECGHIRPDGRNITRQFVTKDKGVAHDEIATFALEVVAQVRAADAAGLHTHQHLSRSGLWLVPLFQNNLFRFMQHSSDHWALFYLEFGHGGRYFR